MGATPGDADTLLGNSGDDDDGDDATIPKTPRTVVPAVLRMVTTFNELST